MADCLYPHHDDRAPHQADTGHLCRPAYSGTWRIGAAVVTVGPSWTVTRYPDRSSVHAHPGSTPEDHARAHVLGYPDLAGMTRDHDLLHTLIAQARGHAHSPTLWGVAHQQPAPAPVVDDEERLVLLVQRLCQVGIDAVLRDYEQVA